MSNEQELMIVFEGREDPRHKEGTHVVTDRNTLTPLSRAIVRAEEAILDNQPVRAWQAIQCLRDHIRFLDLDERRALPLIEGEDEEG